ncbi:MAG: sulfotransferase domain-containing protein [Actinomycetota bacterium]
MTTVDRLPAVTPYGARYVEPEGLPAVLRARALDGFRTFGALTAGLRAEPDYLIIGTKRGGTTSLARWLLLHPQVRPLFPAPETRKGTYYFDVNYGRGHRWYRSHFPTRAAHALRERVAGERLVVGEATPYYLHHPHAAARARQLVPETKVIALLRHPVDRTYGHWAERHRQQVEPLDFADALAAEAGRIGGEEERMLVDPAYVSFAHQHYSYVDQSRYARGLGRWLAVFPRHQVLVLRSEDLYADPSLVYDQVLDFLGLRSFLPAELAGWNQVAKKQVDDAERARLLDLLAPDIAAVEELVGRDLHWT